MALHQPLEILSAGANVSVIGVGNAIDCEQELSLSPISETTSCHA
jgi:hypothetical protein